MEAGNIKFSYILYIAGYYGVLTFSKLSDRKKKEIIKKCYDKIGDELFFIEEGYEFNATLCKFNEINQSFIDFLNSKKDQKQAKHNDWFLVNEYIE